MKTHRPRFDAKAELCLTHAQELDPLCDAFEAVWLVGQRPRIEDFLNLSVGLLDVSVDLQPVLLRELILLEAFHRRRRGENPQPAEYQARFPAFDPAWLDQTAAPEPLKHVAPIGIGSNKSAISQSGNQPLRGDSKPFDELSRIERAWRWAGRNLNLAGWLAITATSLLLGIAVVSSFAAKSNHLAAENFNRDSDALAAAVAARNQERIAKEDALRKQRDAIAALDAEKEAREQAEQVTNFLVEAFRRSNPATDGSELTVAAALDNATRSLRNRTDLSPRNRANLLETIGSSYLELGLHEKAILVYEELLRTDQLAGDFERSKPNSGEGGSLQRTETPTDEAARQEMMVQLGLFFNERRKYAVALPLWRALYSKSPPPSGQLQLGLALLGTRAYTEGEPMIEGFFERLNSDPAATTALLRKQTANFLPEIADLYGAVGMDDKARLWLERAKTLKERFEKTQPWEAKSQSPVGKDD